MPDAGQRRAELAPVVHHAGQRHAAEVDAVIGALARNEHRASALSARLVIRQRDLHRRVNRFRAGIGEEDAVQIARGELGHSSRELEGARMAAQERRDEVEIGQLLMHGFRDFLATVSGRAAEHAGRRVDQLVAAIVPVVHAFAAHDEARRGLEFAVRRERHPILIERDRLGLRLIVELVFGVAHLRISRKRGGRRPARKRR